MIYETIQYVAKIANGVSTIVFGIVDGDARNGGISPPPPSGSGQLDFTNVDNSDLIVVISF